jgi:hypothetical protein
MNPNAARIPCNIPLNGSKVNEARCFSSTVVLESFRVGVRFTDLKAGSTN